MKSNRPEVRVSHSEVVPFKRPRKPVKTQQERDKERKSFKSYFVGGDDAS